MIANLFEGKILVITGTEWLYPTKAYQDLKRNIQQYKLFLVAKTKKLHPQMRYSHPISIRACIKFTKHCMLRDYFF